MLAVRCTLLRDTFEGGRADDPRTVEWPPSWMRLYSALVSVAVPESGDDDVLRALENAGPPSIHVAPALRFRRDTFVPTNTVLKETRHTSLPGRTNGERTWARAVPRSPEIWYRWSDVTLDGAQFDRLRSLCRRVPYLGRSTSPALVEVVEDDGPAEGWLDPIVDVHPDQQVALADPVRCAFPGALDALRAAYEERLRFGEGGDPWQIGLGVDYGALVERPPAETSGPYATLVVLRLARRRLDGRHTARVTHAVSRALMARAEEHLEVLHGHHERGKVHAAFLALLDVGHEHADGQIMGVGIALPPLRREEMRVVAGALTTDGGVLRVTCGPLGVLELERISPLEASVRWSLSVDRWTEPQRRWASVTPVVFDRYPGRNGDLEAEVRRAAHHAGLPEPTAVAVSRDPFVLGAPRFASTDTLRRPGDRVIPYRHVVLDFSRPVRGPVVLGSMRHYGLGLCVPVRVSEEPDDDA